MAILSVALLVLFVLTCALLILMVVIQDSDSDSLGGVFGGGSNSAFGSRSTNVVIKFTYVLGTLFFVSAFSLALVNKSSLGNVEAAARQQTQTTKAKEWWEATPSTPQGTSQGTSEGTSQGTTAPAITPSTSPKP